MLIRLLLTLFLVLPSLANAQISPGERARAYYMDASTAYETKNYQRALESLQSAVDALGSSNARIAAMQVKSYIGLNDYPSARKALDAFYRYPANEQLKNEMGRYLIIVEKAEQRLAELNPATYSIVTSILQSMKSIPSGTFIMGCSAGDVECADKEKPTRQVSIDAFKLMATEVTFAMWDACVAAGGCSHRPEDNGWSRGNRPVIKVSYNDITQQFIPWLNRTTGLTFRLPSEAEWEYAARAGTTTKYSWGNNIGSNNANCDGCGSQWDDSKTAPVKSFSANAFGLYDMEGNVREWVQDCWNNSYQGAPQDGRAIESGDCVWRRTRGGAWNLNPKRFLRVSNREGASCSSGFNNIGFRLAQD